MYSCKAQQKRLVKLWEELECDGELGGPADDGVDLLELVFQQKS